MTVDAAPLAVSCQGITKAYGSGNTRVQALRGVDLDVRAGELLMLVGPSGCGKTTLISVIAGILDQDEGRCLLYGQDLTGFTGKELVVYRGSNIGFVFQSFNLIPTLTASENVAIPLLINGWSMAEAVNRANGRLTEVGLAGRELSLPGQLSGGQQQRVAIVRALMMNPMVLLLDEITSALDPELVSEVLDIVRDLAQGGMTMLLATHEMGFAREVANRVCFLQAGKVYEQGPPAQIFGDPQGERTQAFLRSLKKAGRL